LRWTCFSFWVFYPCHYKFSTLEICHYKPILKLAIIILPLLDPCHFLRLSSAWAHCQPVYVYISPVWTMLLLFTSTRWHVGPTRHLLLHPQAILHAVPLVRPNGRRECRCRSSRGGLMSSCRGNHRHMWPRSTPHPSCAPPSPRGSSRRSCFTSHRPTHDSRVHRRRPEALALALGGHLPAGD
jgi:hypothetical protein